MKPVKFIFGGHVYELKPEAFLKDVSNSGTLEAPPEKQENYEGGCMLEIRPQDDRLAKGDRDEADSHYLMGNTFLKNFVSIYDFDQQ